MTRLDWTDRELDLRRRNEAGEVVVVNLRTDGRLIEWAQAQGRYTRIDRRSRWGNPFRIPQDRDRAEVVRRFRDEHLPTIDPTPLRGRVLGCWCSPLACHGDVLAERVR